MATIDAETLKQFQDYFDAHCRTATPGPYGQINTGYTLTLRPDGLQVDATFSETREFLSEAVALLQTITDQTREFLEPLGWMYAPHVRWEITAEAESEINPDGHWTISLSGSLVKV